MEYFIADTHFQHDNIIGYCDRPFANANEMDEYMIEQWNSVVKPGDTVYHVGDFCFAKESDYPELSGKERHVKTMAKFVARLNGNIVLIRGNHDPKSRTAAIETGIVSCVSELALGDMILTHKPKLDTPPICVNIHGHTHNKPLQKLDKYNIKDYTKFVCVSAELTNYKPISLAELRQRIKQAQRGELNI